MARRRRVRLVLAVALAAFAAGCGGGGYTPRVGPNERPNPKLAYLYGRFYVKATHKEGSLGAYPTLTLVLGCRNQLEYAIKFINLRDVVQIVPVWPARCRIVRIYRTDENGIMRSGGVVDPESTTFQDFEPGGAYYLGDYFAKAGIDYTTRNDRLKRFRAWNMDPAEGRYESTTADMKHQFPGLASLPTENTPLIRPEPTSKSGAVVIDDPNEPLMTPERIARVAPFVRRTYATPAQCEAVCRTGQCLPFRTPSGAAMTCITRCNGDADCSDGLACNCPGGALADCPALVETPKDKLAKICLPAAAPAPRPDGGAM